MQAVFIGIMLLIINKGYMVLKDKSYDSDKRCLLKIH